MEVKNTNSLNVNSTDSTKKSGSTKTEQKIQNNSDFSKELKSIEESQKETKQSEAKKTDEKKSADKSDKKVNKAFDGLNDTIDELNKLNQKDEKEKLELKQKELYDDIKSRYEESGLFNNNFNVKNQQDKLNLQMGSNMGFNGNGQQFSDFLNNNQSQSNSSKDLAEENAILSTMEENIAIANKNMARTKTVENEHGIHKVDKKSNIVVDTVVSYDSVIMDKADVEFFANLAENGILNLSDVQGAEKSSRVSKTLADLLAKSMHDNKPIRIDFDNNISVIIKIDRAGKISADFLPSSQVAEAYLKENLPLLRQRFDDNNIDYNELNQRQRKQQENQDNRKKDRKDE